MSGLGENSNSNFSELLKKAVEDIEVETKENPGEKVQEIIQEKALAKEEKKIVKEDVQSGEPVNENGLISPSTTINGTVSSKGHIRIEGIITGDVSAFGDIKITGKVKGDITGSNIDLEGCSINGNINAKGDVSIGKESMLTGDLKGNYITLDGKVEGNIDAKKGAHFSDTSALKGSIAAPILSMSSGAEILGQVNVMK